MQPEKPRSEKMNFNHSRTGFLIIYIICSIFLRTSSRAQTIHLFGSIHSHSEYSDGNQANDPAYPDARSCFQYVRNSTLNIDFWGISDHNHSGGGMNLPDYRKGVAEADSANENGAFVSLYGMEWGVISSGGHIVIYGIDSLIGWESGNYSIYNSRTDYGSLFSKVAARGSGAFAYLAHMDQTDYGNILAAPYNATWDSAIAGMAIRSGPAFSTDTNYSDPPTGNYFDRYQDLLKAGYHVAPGIDHDSHYIVFGRSHPGRTVVIADTLTKEALMQAFYHRRFYASDDWNCRVVFSLNGSSMGDITTGSAAAGLNIVVNDPDNEQVSSVKIWYGIPGNGVISTQLAQFSNQSSVSYTHPLPIGSTYYYFAEITQADGQKIWTAPIWYTRTLGTGFEFLNFTAERNGDNAVLKWTTANEITIDRYEIEDSPDGLIFSIAGNQSANGGPGQISNYFWTDPSILDQTRYYRIKIIDDSGIYFYSEIKRLDPELRSLDIEVWPSVAQPGIINLAISNNREEAVLTSIFDAGGKLLLTSEIYAVKGKTHIPIDCTGYSAGTYSVVISNADNSLKNSKRFIIK